MLLGVNIDHIAVLREARKINDPSPLDALGICKMNGASQITIHLREDRRHINDEDAKNVISLAQIPVNLECSINENIIRQVLKLKPFRATLVPEGRDEVTTEGGLALSKNYDKIKKCLEILKKSDIQTSLFIDPKEEEIKLAKSLGADAVELHTGAYANIYAMAFLGLEKSQHSIKELDFSKAKLAILLEDEVKRLQNVAKFAKLQGLFLAAGHGLNYQNLEYILKIKEIQELNIGQSIIARAVFTGLAEAIKDMKKLLDFRYD